MTDAIKLEKAEGYHRSLCSLAPVGPGELILPRGRIAFIDAPGLTSIDIERDGEVVSVGVLVYDLAEPIGHGMLVQLDARTARLFAASLLRIADMVEPMKPDA